MMEDDDIPQLILEIKSRSFKEKNVVWETETAFETMNIEFSCLKRRIHLNQSLTKL